ncbi:hypothetical protein KFE25_006441 [Diacronema lutheri]|uniref:Uncharacterized protein n=1 Tax=Diacronema lutheri TaxID=2081491 RepID=A0A8J6CGC7_DIALT|nr:hypothetical protein KFE25_006441 [Diacronema lutheri]
MQLVPLTLGAAWVSQFADESSLMDAFGRGKRTDELDVAETVALEKLTQRWELPEEINSSSGLGGGIAYAVDARFCEHMLARFDERKLFAAMPPLLSRWAAPDCALVHAAVERALGTWAGFSPHLHFVNVTARCAVPGATRALSKEQGPRRCDAAELFIDAGNMSAALGATTGVLARNLGSVRATDGSFRPGGSIVAARITFNARSCWYMDTSSCELFRFLEPANPSDPNGPANYARLRLSLLVLWCAGVLALARRFALVAMRVAHDVRRARELRRMDEPMLGGPNDGAERRALRRDKLTGSRSCAATPRLSRGSTARLASRAPTVKAELVASQLAAPPVSPMDGVAAQRAAASEPGAPEPNDVARTCGRPCALAFLAWRDAHAAGARALCADKPRTAEQQRARARRRALAERCAALLRWLRPLGTPLVVLLVVFPPFAHWAVLEPCLVCYDFNSVGAHEAGHAIGFGHPDEYEGSLRMATIFAPGHPDEYEGSLRMATIFAPGHPDEYEGSLRMATIFAPGHPDEYEGSLRMATIFAPAPDAPTDNDGGGSDGAPFCGRATLRVPLGGSSLDVLMASTPFSVPAPSADGDDRDGDEGDEGDEGGDVTTTSAPFNFADFTRDSRAPSAPPTPNGRETRVRSVMHSTAARHAQSHCTSPDDVNGVFFLYPPVCGACADAAQSQTAGAPPEGVPNSTVRDSPAAAAEAADASALALAERREAKSACRARSTPRCAEPPPAHGLLALIVTLAVTLALALAVTLLHALGASARAGALRARLARALGVIDALYELARLAPPYERESTRRRRRERRERRGVAAQRPPRVLGADAPSVPRAAPEAAAGSAPAEPEPLLQYGEGVTTTQIETLFVEQRLGGLGLPPTFCLGRPDSSETRAAGGGRPAGGAGAARDTDGASAPCGAKQRPGGDEGHGGTRTTTRPTRGDAASPLAAPAPATSGIAGPFASAAAAMRDARRTRALRAAYASPACGTGAAGNYGRPTSGRPLLPVRLSCEPAAPTIGSARDAVARADGTLAQLVGARSHAVRSVWRAHDKRAALERALAIDAEGERGASGGLLGWLARGLGCRSGVGTASGDTVQPAWIPPPSARSSARAGAAATGEGGGRAVALEP